MMYSQEMCSTVMGKQAFARQISRFVREFVVSHFGRMAPALAIKRARRTSGTASPVARFGRPNESQDAATRL